MSDAIQYLPHAHINFVQWDDCIRRAVNSLPYAYSWYLNAVAPQSWDALVLGNYRAVMPLPHGRKWGIRYIYPPSWVQQLGIFGTDPHHLLLTDAFLHALPTTFRYTICQLNAHNPPPTAHAHYTTTTRHNYILPLHTTYAQLQSHYHQNTRRNLRKAQQHQLSVGYQQLSPSQLIAQHQQWLNPHQPRTSQQQYQQLHSLILAAQQHKAATIATVVDPQARLHAAVLWLHAGQRYIYLLSISTAWGRQSGAMSHLIDATIQQHAQTDALIDFEGSMIPSIARFYAGFGAQLTAYQAVQYSQLPPFVQWLQRQKTRWQ